MAAKKKTAAKKTTAKKNTARKGETKNRIPFYITGMIIITVLLAVLMYIDYGEGGFINSAVKNFFCGLFGICGFFVPLLSAGMTAYVIKVKDTKKFWIKLCLGFLAMINVSALINLTVFDTPYTITEAFVTGYTQVAGGGLLGACVALFLETMVQKIASYIILFITLIVLARYITNVPIVSEGFNWLRDIIEEARENHAAQSEETEDIFDTEGEMADKPEKKTKKKRRLKKEKPDYDYINEGDGESSILDAANSFARDVQENNVNPKPDDVKINSEEKETFSNGIDEVFGNSEYPIPNSKKKPAPTEAPDTTEENLPAEKKEKAEKISDKEKEQFNDEFNKAIEKPLAEYKIPPINLLNKPKAVSGDKREAMRHTAERLISVLGDFGVKAKLLHVTNGPTVTRYEIQPDTGVKLSKIVGLADDIALQLAVSTVLVAPVPGKAAVGIEIPNSKVSAVTIREMLESDAFKKAKSRLTVALGKDIGGNIVLGDIEKMPHVLIAGATGSGKSVCINSIIMSILYKSKPEDVKLIMVDPKVVELGVYNGIPHLLVPVVTDPKKAAGALNWAVTEMMKRYDLFKDTGVRKLESYNKLMESTGGDKIPQLVIIIDELADLMMVSAKEVEDYIVRLTQLARAAGIHLIIATQRPSVDVITGLIKANVPSRIAFAVSSQVDSRTILDKGGAEKLLGMGDMLYHPYGARASTRVQGAFVSDAEIEKVLEYIKENVGETHYSEDLAEEIERHATGENGVTPDVEEDGDALLPEAIELAVSLGQISTSGIQRRLGVGYARAGRIIDQMEARGIISGANGSKPRDVLVSHADLAVGGHTAVDYDDEVYDDTE